MEPEATSPTTPETTEPTVQPEEAHIGSNVCDVCIHDNLLKTVGIQTCHRCYNPYCIHFASKADALHYCVSCLSDLQLTTETVSQITEHYNEKTDKIYRYVRNAKRIEMGGLDWLFVQRKIKDMSDAEVDMLIEYHRQYCQLLLDDMERRRNEKTHRFAGVKIVPTSATTTTSTVTTTTKKSTTTKSNKAQAQVEALMSTLLGSMSLDQISALLKKGNGK
jgi:23S rRNA maturation mini-RNase III